MNAEIEQTLMLKQLLKNRIEQSDGWIPFDLFFNTIMYEPGLGYYSAGLHKLGASGDFITAPQMGDLFAKCHARSFAAVLAALAKPVIFELGAGTGKFCVDVLNALEQEQQLPDRYVIFEVSADLKQVQQQAVDQLPAHLSRLVSWVDAPLAEPYEGIVFANEVLDALPVEVFRAVKTGYQRLMLEDQAGHLTEVWQPFPPKLALQLEAKGLDLEPGYRSEFIPNLDAWVTSITQGLEKGMVHLVDYGFGRPGFYHPQRHTGTLVCHRRHQANFNPYQDVGLQDITAFVDFTAVAEAIETAGLTVSGYTTQGDFLMACGIEQWLDPAGDYPTYFGLENKYKKSNYTASFRQIHSMDEFNFKNDKFKEINVQRIRLNTWPLMSCHAYPLRPATRR